MVLPLKCLVRGRCLFTVYIWGKPLAPSEVEGNSDRGHNFPIDKPKKRPDRSLGISEGAPSAHLETAIAFGRQPVEF
jgi:hypothetical protein